MEVAEIMQPYVCNPSSRYDVPPCIGQDERVKRRPLRISEYVTGIPV